MFFFWWVALYWNHNFSLSYLTIIFLIKRLFTSYCLACLGPMQQWSQRQTQSLSATIICFNMFRLFYTGEQETIKGFSRLQTQTGTEMLLVPHQRSPSEGKVRCFYTVQMWILPLHTVTQSLSAYEVTDSFSFQFRLNSNITHVC